MEESLKSQASARIDDSEGITVQMDWVEGLIHMYAEELEYKPGEERPAAAQAAPEEEKKGGASKSNALNVPRRLNINVNNSAVQERVRGIEVAGGAENQLNHSANNSKHKKQGRPASRCMLKSRNGNFKPFSFEVKGPKIIMMNLGIYHNDKPALTYNVENVQSVVARFTTTRSEIGRVSESYLVLIDSKNTRRSIYFESQLAAQQWHLEIVKQQGYLKKRFAQYKQIRVLGSGGFGKVFLCEHKNSKQEVAVKQINKTKIKRSFGRNGNTFSELEVMKEACRGSSAYIIDLLDCFEDSINYYTVTKYMPYGDLQKYLTVNMKKGPLAESAAKLIMF